MCLKIWCGGKSWKILRTKRGLRIQRMVVSLVHLKSLRPVSIDSVTARFHIPICHQDWNKTIYKTTPSMKHFTLLFSRLSKAFNYCKMIGSHARWWNDLAMSGDFISFHCVGNNTRGISKVRLLPSFSSLFHAKSIVLLTWRSNKCVWHPGETPTKTSLIVSIAITWPGWRGSCGSSSEYFAILWRSCVSPNSLTSVALVVCTLFLLQAPPFWLFAMLLHIIFARGFSLFGSLLQGWTVGSQSPRSGVKHWVTLNKVSSVIKTTNIEDI